MSVLPPYDPTDGAAPEGGAPHGFEAGLPGDGTPFELQPFDPASADPVEMFFDGGPAPVAPAPVAPAVPEAAPVATRKEKKAPRDKTPRARAKDGLVLGLHVAKERVYGVLVRPTADGYEPLRQFVRNRVDGAAAGDMQAVTPDAMGAAELAGDADGGIQFGSVGEIDFAAEFAGLVGNTNEMSVGGAGEATVVGRVQPIVFEVRDILEECAQAGFPRPSLAFTIGDPDVDYVEVLVPLPKKVKKGKDGKPVAEPDAGVGGDKPAALVALLQKQGVTVDKERVGFVPMTSRGGQRRYLAVLPTATEPVVPSIEMLREASRYRKTPFKTLQAEVPLLVGLAHLSGAASRTENTAVVRVGAEDTLVLLISGGVLHHVELMQSVTAFDGPDTICSRVLLQQDVQGVGTVHNVVVMAEEREAELVQGFAAFYPEARVETLREGVARLGLVGPYGPLAPNLVEASGAALAGILRKGPFDDVNLLPSHQRKAKARLDLSFGWHTVVVAALLFLSVLYFVYSYVSQKNEIAAAEQRLAEFPPEALMTAPQLQARIDSLRQRQAELTHHMGVLDSLLFGTDRWTQTMLVTTRAAAATGGIWIEEWTPSGTDIGLMGYATARGQVVRLAERLDATIEEVSFKEIRERPVFQYRMRFASPPQLPQTARVVREQAGEPLPAPPAEPLAGFDASGASAPPAAPAAPPPAPEATAPPPNPPAPEATAPSAQ